MITVQTITGNVMASDRFRSETFATLDIQKIAAELAALPPPDAPTAVGKIRAIRLLEPAIRGALAKGHTLAKVVEWLNERHGLNTSAHAVRNYLARRGARGREKTPGGAAAALPPAGSSSPPVPLQPGEFRRRPDTKDL